MRSMTQILMMVLLLVGSTGCSYLFWPRAADDVTKDQADTPAYDLSYTNKKELSAIFRRLWKFKDDQPQRDQHLDLMVVELQELRATLQTIK